MTRHDNWSHKWRRWLLPQPAAASVDVSVPTGLYHYQRQRGGQYVRYHLRVEPDGQALLIAAAAEAVRLSPVGAYVAKALLEGQSAQQLATDLPIHDASKLVGQVDDALAQLGQPSARYPIFNLADPAAYDRPLGMIAPFQADVVPGTSEAVHAVLDKLWGAGIPHARFILPDGELDRDLIVMAVRHAEDLGMITGVRARAKQWVDSELIEPLAKVGLDYVVVPWGVEATRHEAIFGVGDLACMDEVIRLVRSWEMTPVVDVPLVRETSAALEDAIDRLADWHVRHAEVFAIAAIASDEDKPSEASRTSVTTEPGRADDTLHAFDAQELRQLAGWIEDVASERFMQLIWLPPVAQSAHQSVTELARRGPRAGGDVTIRVEADGTVVAPRGPRIATGNLLMNTWTEIWHHEAFQRYRQMVQRNTHCQQCPGLAICAADCPADAMGWAQD